MASLRFYGGEFLSTRQIRPAAANRLEDRRDGSPEGTPTRWTDIDAVAIGEGSDRANRRERGGLSDG